jgi:hypothetical protein
MNSYNSLVLNECTKLSILYDKLPSEIIEHIEQFMPTLYLCVHRNRLIIININTFQTIHIKLKINVIDAIFSLCGSYILCKTLNSIEQIDIKTHAIKQLYTNVIKPGILTMDICCNKTVITNVNNEINVIKNNNIIFNKIVDYKILNCKFLSENELIIVYDKKIILYNIINNKTKIIYEYKHRIVYLTIYNNQLLVCFSNNSLYIVNLKLQDSQLYNFNNFEIKGAEFSPDDKYIFLFGFKSNLSIIKILDKITMNQIAVLNLNENGRGLWIVSSTESIITSETFFMFNVWCLKTFKLLKTISKFKINRLTNG